MEVVKVFDYQHNYLGDVDRDIAHKYGLWHETFHCWIIRKRGDKKYVLFQKRASTKKSYPNMLDIPAAGHLMFNEEKEDGVRELQEELGIKSSTDKMIYLGIRIEVVETPKLNNKEFQHVYLFEDSTPLDEYVLQEEEVSGLVEIELEQGLRLFFGEIDSLVCDSVFLENGQKVRKEYILKRDSVIERPDEYYKKIFMLAKCYFDGYKNLAI